MAIALTDLGTKVMHMLSYIFLIVLEEP